MNMGLLSAFIGGAGGAGLIDYSRGERERQQREDERRQRSEDRAAELRLHAQDRAAERAADQKARQALADSRRRRFHGEKLALREAGREINQAVSHQRSRGHGMLATLLHPPVFLARARIVAVVRLRAAAQQYRLALKDRDMRRAVTFAPVAVRLGLAIFQIPIIH